MPGDGPTGEPGRAAVVAVAVFGIAFATVWSVGRSTGSPTEPRPLGRVAVAGASETAPAERPVQYAELPPAVRAELDRARAFALRHPTARDAVSAGYHRVSVALDGIGVHYMRRDLGFDVDEVFDPGEPEQLIYDGAGPSAPIVGVAYVADGSRPPEGFAGDADVWHDHPRLCVRGGRVVIGDLTAPEPERRMTAGECERAGGDVFEFPNFWMVHAWVVPGWSSPDGIFSHDHARLRA